MDHEPKRITFFLPHFPEGGQEQVTLLLMTGLAERGHHVELLLERREGAYLARVPVMIPVRELQRRSRWSGYRRFLPGWPREAFRHLRGALGLGPRSIPLHRLIGLIDYLESSRPDILISAHDRAPILALWAAAIARHRVATMIVEHSLFSYNLAAARSGSRSYAIMQQRRALMRRLYPDADALVAVSQAAAIDLADCLALPRDTVQTIYNPVVSASLSTRAQEPVHDSWFAHDAPPVILAAARLAPEKALNILIDAFSRLLSEGHNIHLAILGEGPEREGLNRQIAELALDSRVRMPGWVDNPYAWMRHSALFVSSSAFEGLSNTLIEAMACGCPVVSSDCPGGPREILDDGAFGRLVPVGDAAALAEAMAHTLASPPSPERLRTRAADFSVEHSVDTYEAKIQRICTELRP